jgi:hypothetical protein
MGRLKILVCGMIAGDPHQGGATWAVLQYLLGLRALGHQVSFVEPIRAAALRPAGSTLSDSVNARYFDVVVERYRLAEHGAALLVTGSQQTHGCSYANLRQIAASADLLINISGLLEDEALLNVIGHRVYLDLDPAFTQLWHAVEGIDMRFAAHTHFVTIGQAIGHPGCIVPECGRRWITTPQPVVLDHWPVARTAGDGPLTTVGHFRGYGSVRHDGVLYGQKAHSLRPFYPLPTLTTQRFLLALAIHPDEVTDVQALRDNGWGLCDPSSVAATPWTYQEFIHGSKAEFGIAKSGYVLSRCGWFSDRSVCYLASGRPVIAQDTGFGAYLATGHGLFSFTSIEQVLDAIEAVNADYARHATAAREIAAAHFDSALVLTRLIEQVGACARA